jgi:hypothetical protein
MQWWQFRSTPMRSVILAKVSVLNIAWEAWRFARGDGNAIARRQRARLPGLVSYAPRLSTAMAACHPVKDSHDDASRQGSAITFVAQRIEEPGRQVESPAESEPDLCGLYTPKLLHELPSESSDCGQERLLCGGSEFME